MLAARVGGVGKKRNEDIFHEFRLNALVNRLFTIVERLEVRMTLAGVRWPVGGSRVVVGRAI